MPSRWLLMAIVDCKQDAVFPVSNADDDELRDAPVRVTQQPPVTRWRGCQAAGGGRGSASQQGFPVVLPVREGSWGGSYGTAAEGGTCSVLR